jgi:predicted alpha/beta-hydrolase family hydrolase
MAGADSVSAEYEPATSEHEAALFICAHGAGGNMSDKGVLAVAEAMRANGMGVVRFNFPYRERKSGRPDPMPKLTDTFAAVASHARNALAPARLIIGGRSMGGRAASVLAAAGFPADGLLLLAYPLHPPGKPHQLRDAHLPDITMPVLCFNGTRDEFCTRSLMEQALTKVIAEWDMRWIDGADHSFHMLKSSGRTDAEVMAEIGQIGGQWLSHLAR